MNLKILAAIALSKLILLGTTSYWYVFIAGAPQIDAMPAQAQTQVNHELKFEITTFQSSAMHEARRYGVVLPPGYDRNSSRHYPVIFLLHGGHGGERDYQDKAALTTTLNTLYEQGKLPHSIVITPDGNDDRRTNPFWDPDYIDGPHGNVATLIGEEVVQAVKSNYRTLNEPQYWAIGGLSSGAWGSFNIGLRRTKQFNVFFSHTGYFHDQSGDANSPIVFIHDLPESVRKSVRVYLDAGENDEKYLEATREFRGVLDQLGIYNEFHIFPGGHGIYGQDTGWNYWRKHLHDSLSFVGKQFFSVTSISSESDKAKNVAPKPELEPAIVEPEAEIEF